VPLYRIFGFQYSPWWLLIGILFFVVAALAARKYLKELWQRLSGHLKGAYEGAKVFLMA